MNSFFTISFKALKDIEINEEITVLYRGGYLPEGTDHCLCTSCFVLPETDERYTFRLTALERQTRVENEARKQQSFSALSRTRPGTNDNYHSIIRCWDAYYIIWTAALNQSGPVAATYRSVSDSEREKRAANHQHWGEIYLYSFCIFLSVVFMIHQLQVRHTTQYIAFLPQSSCSL